MYETIQTLLTSNYKLNGAINSIVLRALVTFSECLSSNSREGHGHLITSSLYIDVIDCPAAAEAAGAARGGRDASVQNLAFVLYTFLISHYVFIATLSQVPLLSEDIDSLHTDPMFGANFTILQIELACSLGEKNLKKS